jgi:hypothetical protein
MLMIQFIALLIGIAIFLAKKKKEKKELPSKVILTETCL